MDEQQVKDCTIFECFAGSHAYGTSTPASDVDVRGVCVPKDPSYYVGMGLNRFEQKDKGWSNKDDKVIYDFRKALKLMSDGNPNMVDMLYTRETDFLKCTYVWERVLEKRELFLSKKMRYTYGGYAFAQLKRIKRHRNYLLNPPKKKPERSDYGLPDRKLISAEQAGAYQWLLAKIMQDSIEVMKISPEARQELYGINYIGAVQSGVPEETADLLKNLTGATDEWVTSIMAEKRYENAVKDYNSYQSWKKNRNKKRQDIEQKYGYDTKHAMHLVRLMRMGLEILETGKVHVYRPDREELLAIRNGAWEYERVEAYAEECDKKMDELYKTSFLPKVPKQKQIDELCVDVIKGEVFYG